MRKALFGSFLLVIPVADGEAMASAAEPGNMPSASSAAHPTRYGSASNRDAIRRVVREHLSEIRHCYDQLLRKAPQARGEMNVNFAIRPDGSVNSAKVTQSDLPASLSTCVVEVVSRMMFPAARGDGNLVIDYPFAFEPG